MSANFTPTQTPISDLRPFRMWCQKVLPAIYDESLSYYEVLCKVVKYLNDTVSNVEILNTNVSRLYDAYILLQNYVNDYFDQNFPELVSAKLDEMAEDGTLTALISVYIDPMFASKSAEIDEAIEEQNDNIDEIESRVVETLEEQNDDIDELEARMSAFIANHSGLTGETVLADLSASADRWYAKNSTVQLEDVDEYKYIDFYLYHHGVTHIQRFPSTEVLSQNGVVISHVINETTDFPSGDKVLNTLVTVMNVVNKPSIGTDVYSLDTSAMSNTRWSFTAQTSDLADWAGWGDNDAGSQTYIYKVVGVKEVADAEVVDIRVGADGIIYPTAGDAVRTQISTVSDNFAVTVHRSENLFNAETIETGCYYWTDGRHESSGYNSSALIPVEEGKTYYFQNGNQTVAQGRNMQTVRFAVGYDNSYNPVVSASGSNVGSYTVQANVKYLRISSGSTIMTAGNYYMVSEYSQPVDFIPYFEPYTTSKLKNTADSEQTNQNTRDIASLTLAVERNTEDISESIHGKNPLIFNSHVQSLSANNNLTVCEYSDNKKNEYIELTANFQSFGNLTIAHGKDSYGGGYFVITPTKIQTYTYNGTLLEEFTHGLNLSGFINVMCYTKNDHSCKSQISIMSEGGDYKVDTTRYYSSRSSVYCNADFDMTNVTMKYVINDGKENVWIFGDSYVGLGDPTRWAGQMIMDGHKHALISGYGGATSANEILTFREYLDVTKPKYLVWTLGMNNGDSSTAINTQWKNCVDEVIATCDENDITVILATIPNTPTINNTFKNAYVKASGKRYVDFAKAVNAESAGSTWYTGMLSSDNTHPTTLGGKALMRQFLLDVPEVLYAEE